MDSNASSTGTLSMLRLDLSTYGQHLQTLGQRFDAIFSAAEAKLKQLEATATAATDQYVATAQQIADSLTAMRQQAEGEAAAATDAIGQTTQLLGTIEQKRASNLQELETAFQQLEQTLRGIDTAAAQAFGAVSQEAQATIAAANQGAGHVHDVGGQITQSFGQVDDDVTSGVQSMEAALAQLLQELEDAHRQHEAACDQHVAAVHAQFAQHVDASVQTLTQNVDEIKKVLTSLEQIGDRCSSEFRTAVQYLAASTDDLGNEIDRLQPQLDDARHL